jgi:hypothetical protein
MIPEAVYTFTSATFEKKKKKKFITPFGTFTYKDVPSSVYPMGLEIIEEGNYSFMIASREKAICDQLYKVGPVTNYDDLRNLLFDDFRIDEQELKMINLEYLGILAERYPSTNVKRFNNLMRRMWR